MKRFLWRNGSLTRRGNAFGLFVMALGLSGLMLVATPKQAWSICEFPAEAWAGWTSSFNATLLALINTFTASAACPAAPPICGALPNAYAVEIAATQQVLIRALETQENTILNKLKDFWDKWLDALKDMTAQLSGSLSDGTRHLNSMFDASDETQKERNLQEVEHRAKKQYQPTNQSCRFDTAARPMASAMRTGKFISQGLTKEMNDQGSNNTNRPESVGGQAGVNQSRWQIYKNNFCDGTSNAGYPGCTTAQAQPNADTQTSTIFGKETIDLKDQATRLATEAFVHNITGFEIPDPYTQNVLKTPAGKQSRATSREYLAQMDAASSLVTSLIGERAPITDTNGTLGSEIQALRTKLGVTDASAHPSEREIRQSVVEQLWDPNYWVEMGDSPSTITQKEVYLQAYNLMMLYKIIEKTEKISTAYSIQTADMLESDHGEVRTAGEMNAGVR